MKFLQKGSYFEHNITNWDTTFKIWDKLDKKKLFSFYELIRFYLNVVVLVFRMSLVDDVDVSDDVMIATQ